MRHPILAAAIVLAAAAATAQNPVHVSLTAHVPFTPCTTGSVWAFDARHVLVARRFAGFSVVDVSDPQNPVATTILPPGYPVGPTWYGVGDIKSDGRYIYATDEGLGRGVFIYDAAASVTNPSYVGNVSDWRLAGGTHNCWIERDHLYCVANGTRRVEVYDVSTRNSARWVATLGNGIPGAAAHDVIVLDDRAYCSFLGGGFAIYDVANPATPNLILAHDYPDSFTHNAWPSEDRQLLYTTDENVVGGRGGVVRIWDISNPLAVRQVGTFRAGQTDSVVHNVYVRGDHLFVAYYKEGLRVASLRDDPTNPVEIASYDTFPGNGRGCFGQTFSWGFPFAGAWGVDPFGSGDLLVSDLDSGLYLLRLQPVAHTFTAQPATLTAGQTLVLDLDYRNASVATLAGLGAIVLSEVNGQPVTVPLLVDARVLTAGQASGPQVVSLTVPPGMPPTNLAFTAYAALLRPTIFSGTTTLPVTIR